MGAVLVSRWGRDKRTEIDVPIGTRLCLASLAADSKAWHVSKYGKQADDEVRYLGTI